jgi:hypothetical protein
VSDKRDHGGKFTAGNKGGPGRKPGRPDLYPLADEFARAEGIDLRAALWRVTRKLLEDAEGGDKTAARLVLEHLVMPAKQVLELMGANERNPDGLTTEQIERGVASIMAMESARAAALEAAKAQTSPRHNGNGHRPAER